MNNTINIINLSVSLFSPILTALLAFFGYFRKKQLADKEELDKRFESMNKRFEAIDKRFEAIDKRFDILESEVKETNRLLVSHISNYSVHRL